MTVTVKRPGFADSSNTRTVVVWNDYAIAKSRGSIEPRVEVADPTLRQAGDQWTGRFSIRNRETSPMHLTSLRVDQVPCDVEAPTRVGATAAVDIVVAAGGEAMQDVAEPVTSVAADTCGVVIHYSGDCAGQSVQARVDYDLEQTTARQLVEPATTAILNYIVDNGMVTDPQLVTDADIARLYRERRIPVSVVESEFYQDAPEAGEGCDPNDPGTPPPGGDYTCQPTGQWESEGPAHGGNALVPDGYVANAMKGDALMVRGCKGIVGPLLQSVHPPQKYTHTGMMTKNRVELRHATASEDRLIEEGGRGLDGQATKGFHENMLRYLWPGTVTAPISQAFTSGGRGVALARPSGVSEPIQGFVGRPERCLAEPNVVFPRVMKPAPEYEGETRPRLHAAAEAAKLINAHYRFSTYSDATVREDENGPAPMVDESAGLLYFGPDRAVCSSFVRLALKDAGIEVDADKLLPFPSDVGDGVPDGTFNYTASERLDAGEALATYLKNMARGALYGVQDEVDDYWWAGGLGGAGVAVLLSVPGGLAVGAGTGILVTTQSGPLVKWATDAPNNVANQVANCFATDWCSIEARNSKAWKDTEPGIAVSPEDVMLHYDSPATGGVYGYHERLVYRGRRYHPLFAWTPAEGTYTLRGSVTNEGQPSAGALVEVMGIANPGGGVPTDSAGAFELRAVPGPNIMIHASQWIGDEATGQLREATACYVTPTDNGQPLPYLTQVACNDLTTPVSDIRYLPGPEQQVGCYAAAEGHPGLLRQVDCQSGMVTEPDILYDDTLELQLSPPSSGYRTVTITGEAWITNCDCYNNDESHIYPLLAQCDVSDLSPETRTGSFSIKPDRLCADKVGGFIGGTCTLLPDNRTVYIEGKVQLLKGPTRSCGGEEVRREETFEATVREGQPVDIGGHDMYTNHTCCPLITCFECHDNAHFYDLQATNQRSL